MLSGLIIPYLCVVFLVQAVIKMLYVLYIIDPLFFSSGSVDVSNVNLSGDKHVEQHIDETVYFREQEIASFANNLCTFHHYI
jgi:hypothetical protein